MKAETVLIVDDDAAFRETWRLNLQDLGYPAATASTAEEARSAIARGAFEVALVDLMLRGPGGGAGGLDVVREVLNHSPDCVVIVVTAYPDPQRIQDAFAAGASDFLMKDQFFRPLFAQKLAIAIDRVRSRRLVSRPGALRHRDMNELLGSALTEQDPNRKGALLEDLMVDLLAAIPGFVPTPRRQNEFEELDVWVRNESEDEFWRKEAPYLLVECKNWSKPTPVEHVRILRDKVRYKAGRCRTGMLVATSGFTEPVARVLELSHAENILVVPIDGLDLRRLVEAGDRNAILKQIYDRAVRGNGGRS